MVDYLYEIRESRIRKEKGVEDGKDRGKCFGRKRIPNGCTSGAWEWR